ncbi:foldase PrsA [Pontibacillus halophilus JSM 076056 = DSM 19796]|uniref:Foldase protein PrsA n=1 Tax=Pontibacillus halophilus JSM 076056 = DSM 19796 TaxID=1385510 RepID=A0A0A5GRA0_9BACI|nr:peptidylprolyl isomerase [Pontibacillus halophilus]KGX93783.1 foldase PrsA [Pontibacillus halophilus JSM 076056 = DSM 19796]
MKRTLIGFSLGLSILALSACTTSASGEVVAETKNGTVTEEEFYEELKNTYGAEVLKEMLYEKVLKSQYEVTDEEVTAEVDQLKESYGDQWESVLAQNGYKDEEALKEDIKASLLKEKAATEGIEITDEELKQYYENKKTELEASHILVEDEETAKKVKEELSNGADFTELASEYSIDTSTSEAGGELGFFGTGEMTYAFEQAAYNLETDEISDPVESTYGYHIIKVTDKRDQEEVEIGSYEEEKDALKDELIQRQADTNKLSEMMNEADISIKLKDLKEKIQF